MLKKVLTASFLLFFIWTASASAQAGNVPLRIVSLKPVITDVIVAMGHADSLVGVTKYCDVPKGSNAQVIADYSRPFIEKIVALEPDLVLGSEENSSRTSVERLSSLGVKVKLFPFSSLSESLSSTRAIGLEIGDKKGGIALSEKIQKQIDALRTKWGKAEKRRLLVVWGEKPMVVAGKGSYMDDLLQIIGAKNVVSRGNLPYPRMSTEELISLDPEFIVDLSMGSEEKNTGARSWEKIASLSAVKNGRVIKMSTTDFRLGPNIIVGLDRLAEKIHE